MAAACRSSLRWRWWQWAIAVMHYCDAILGTHGSCSKSFWDLPPHRRPWKAGPSQNDDFLPRFGIYPLHTTLQGTSIPKRFGTRASGNDTTLPIVAHSTQALSQRTPAATQGTLAVGTRHFSSYNKAFRSRHMALQQLAQRFSAMLIARKAQNTPPK